MRFALTTDPFTMLQLHDLQGCKAVFTGRRGGISSGPYAALNLGHNTDDDPEFIAANYRRLYKSLEINPESICRVMQVHGSQVAEARPGDPQPETDGLITQVPGRILLMNFADCYPLYLFSRTANRAVGLAHCGWRGINNGLVERMVYSLERRYDLLAPDLAAVIGPGICRNCFTVGDDVAGRFVSQCQGLPDGGKLVERWPGGGRVNLPGIIRALLLRLGIPGEAICTSGFCTACSSHLFFSHRRDHGVTGRMAALVWLDDGGPQ